MNLAPPARQPTAARPWTVTTAAVIAFVLAGLALSLAIGDFVWATQAAGFAQSHFFGAGLLNIVFAALLIWAGADTWRGATSSGLFMAAVAIIAVNVVSIVIVLATGGSMLITWPSAVLVALSASIIALLVRQSSKRFFRTRAGTTT